MVVLSACGIGLTHFLRPVWILSFWMAVAVAVVSFYFSPIASVLISKVQNTSNDAYKLAFAPGEFHRSRKENAIFYVEHIDANGKFDNIFVSNEQLGKSGILVAKTGFEYTDSKTGDQFLVLQHGTRYEGIPGQADYKILDYDTYALRVEPQIIASPSVNVSADEIPTQKLLNTNDEQLRAEWQWRFAKPLSLFILAVFALVFAYTDARRGRFANLFTAMLVYFIYANMLGIGQALMHQGRLPVTWGLWSIHAIFALLAIYFVWRRGSNKPLLPTVRWPLLGFTRT